VDDAAASCPFCRILRGELTPGVVAFRDRETAVFPSRHQFPRNRGHMLVVPVRHVARIYEVDRDVAGPLMTTVARVAAAVKAVPRFAGDGFVGLDGGLGRFEPSLEERIAQARALADALAGPPSPPAG
jgi:diadenosine tetraphosphate (Ap4A) HIT family hydrolase